VALRALFRVSERFACRVVGQHRITQRHGGRVVDIAESKLRRRLAPGDRSRAHPLGPADGLPPAAARRLAGEPQAGAPPLEGGRSAAPHSSQAEASSARRRLGAASPGRAPAPGVGDGLPVRRHGRWASAEVPERD
jgi:hypothetical protein